MLDLLLDPNAWAALLTLTALEVVLGIDNLVFISILTTRLDARRSKQARGIGLSLAFVFRILLLASLSFIIGLRQPVLELRGLTFSWRDIILIAGGLFLIAKATREIHGEVEANDEEEHAPNARHQSLTAVIFQLAVIDL